MPSIFQAVVLGIIEGVTEFLPISSTGHLIAAGALLKLPNSEFMKSFEVVIQLGAILAIVVLYARRLLVDWPLLKKVAVAFLPTGALGLLFYKIIKQYLLGNVAVVIGALAIGGVVLIVFERLVRKQEVAPKSLGEMSYRQAVIIGLSQAVAMIPGVSRSGATIVGSMALGFSRESAVEFSFLLAIPTMAAASGLDVIKNYKELLVPEGRLVLAVGFIVSFVVALGVVKWLLRYVRSHSFQVFGIYRIVAALALWWFIF